MAFFSKNSADYAAAIQAMVKPTYTSKYGTKIEETMNKILNKEDFKYDFNADPLYQQYKDQYVKLGNEAAQNAAASASALTGGYGNSYAGTAASQANQQYLTQLNDKIPELYNAAMQKYQMETENLYSQFGMLETEEGRQYGIYRDKVSDYYSDLNDLRSGHATALGQENADRDYTYKVSRDAVGDSQWAQNFAYQQARDKVADEQWQKNYELALKKAKSGGGSGGGKNNTPKVTSENTVNSKGMTTTDVDKHMITIAGMNEKSAEDYIKALQQDGKISKEDANYLWQQYQKLGNRNTTYSIFNNIASL